jgi:hypothetical protein
MKLLQAFYLCLASYYGALLLFLAYASFMRGDIANAAYCLFWAVLGISFGLLTARLLQVYSARKAL